nr:retrotransposon protein, putative, Ty3-gypsy subclass [Tanacetum cinerariifolium]
MSRDAARNLKPLMEMKVMEMVGMEIKEMEMKEMEMVMGTEEEMAITLEDLCLLESAHIKTSCIAYEDAIRDRGIDARVVVEAVDREEIETGARGPEHWELVSRDAARNLKPLMGNEGNGNGWNGNKGNGNGGNGNEGNGNGNGNRGGNGYNFRGFMPARECTYQDFLKCQPLNFNGTEGVVGLTRWFEKMETVFHISICPKKYQLKYATCTLLNSTLTWWNSHKRTIRIESAYAMSWEELMKLMTEGNVIAAEPTKLQDAIRIANNLMDQKLKGYARSAENKRRLENNPRDNRGQQSVFKRSFVSSTFSTMLDVAPSTLDTSYAVKLADGRISKTNVILRGCTLGLLGHSFDIDLMLIELGSFDVIVSMDWLAKYHVLIVYDEKVVRTPYGDEVLIIRCDGCDGRSRKEHEGHLKLILQLFKKEELYAKFSKCEFWLSKVQFLGHVIDSKGIHIDPANTESIKDWASPKTPIEIRQFLGLSAVLIQNENAITYASCQLKLELLRDYDCEIRYHPGKANVVADALSRKER